MNVSSTSRITLHKHPAHMLILHAQRASGYLSRPPAARPETPDPRWGLWHAGPLQIPSRGPRERVPPGPHINWSRCRRAGRSFPFTASSGNHKANILLGDVLLGCPVSKLKGEMDQRTATEDGKSTESWMYCGGPRRTRLKAKLSVSHGLVLMSWPAVLGRPAEIETSVSIARIPLEAIVSQEMRLWVRDDLHSMQFNKDIINMTNKLLSATDVPLCSRSTWNGIRIDYLLWIKTVLTLILIHLHVIKKK